MWYTAIPDMNEYRGAGTWPNIVISPEVWMGMPFHGPSPTHVFVPHDLYNRVVERQSVEGLTRAEVGVWSFIAYRTFIHQEDLARKPQDWRILTIPKIAQLVGISQEEAGAAVTSLLHKGFLEEIDGSYRVTRYPPNHKPYLDRWCPSKRRKSRSRKGTNK